jgi:hypothetical protein
MAGGTGSGLNAQSWRISAAVLAMAVLPELGCGKPHYARYASWEPTSPALPDATDRALARRWLAQSREIWRRERDSRYPRFWPFELAAPPDVIRYSYVRAFEREDGSVDFTVQSVEGQAVVYRALIGARPGTLAQSLDPRDARSGFETRWVETRVTLGSHGDGAPVATIDELYDLCERKVLSPVRDAAPRLYFRPDGILMHCAYLVGQCDECPKISLQSIGAYPILDVIDPARAVCVEPWGIFPPFSKSFTTEPNYVCMPPPGLRPRHPSIGGLLPFCSHERAACASKFKGIESPSAAWIDPHPTCGTRRTRVPSFLETGKRDPLAAWWFPFVMEGGIDCGDGAGEVYIGLPAPPYAVPDP